MNWSMFGAYAIAGAALIVSVVGLLLRVRGKNSTSDGLRTWFVISLVLAVVVAVAAIALFLAGLNKEWVADRYASALAPLITVVTAGIGSAGAARHAIAQTEAARKARLEDSVKEMWKRFEGAAKQLADETHFAIRVAGVHSLVGLADDWIRHHDQIGTTDRDAKKAECEIIVDTLCGYLRMNTHLPKQDETDETQSLNTQETLVNEAILAQFRLHLGLHDSHGNAKRGAWARLGLELDLHGTDLSKWITRDTDLSKAVLTGADLYDADLRLADLTGADLRKADLCAADLTDAKLVRTDLEGVKYDARTRWPDGAAFPPPNSVQMPVGGDHERVGRIT